MMRECKACDGTGVGIYAFSPRMGVNWPEQPCAACLGSGQVSERIPAADALADAATLRAHTGALWLAAYAASAIAFEMPAAFDRPMPPLDPYTLYSMALNDARVAFHAVPMLRGEGGERA